MKSTIIKSLGMLGVVTGILGMGGSAHALKNVPFAAYNVWGPSVTDANPGVPVGTDFVTARASKTNFPADAGHIDVTANVGAYQSGLQVNCSTGTVAQNVNGTNTTNGDISLACPGGGVVVSGFGAINYL
jgi:hypothetical protein